MKGKTFERFNNRLSDVEFNIGVKSMPQITRSCFMPQAIHVVTMCVHISSSCNLACKYCFGNHSADKLSFDDIRRFTEHVTRLYPRADRYIIDMSGAGEPLLNKDTILKVAELCRELSDRFVREFLPMLVTNGTLLDKQTVEFLQSNGVLFGVSLDGTKECHDRNRVFPSGKDSYETVKENVSNIKHKAYVGAAVTYSEPKLLQSFLSAFELLPTVSMKPVRYTKGNELDAQAVCDSYTELAAFLFDKTVAGEHQYLHALLNGDDYLGKFLKRFVSRGYVSGRCDAGIARFALAADGGIYCCPAGVGKDKCRVGDLENGIRLGKVERMWAAQFDNEKCNGCAIKPICGGECKIVSYNKFGDLHDVDDNMCRIKQHLYRLSAVFCEMLKNERIVEYDRLVEDVSKIDGYYLPDERLIDAVYRSNGKYTFSQLKKIKDNDLAQFNSIYFALCSCPKVQKTDKTTYII